MKVKALTYNQLQTLCWTEDNRLQAVKDNQMGAYYNYDASGERNLKLTGAVVQMSQNGVPYDYVMLESPTLYASGLITINERGYTKHYFEENKRVCSNIGGGFRDAGYDITEPIGLITSFEEQLGNAKDGIFKTFEQCIKSPVDLENTKDKIVNVMKDHEKDRNEEEYQFYYTNDHLGSSTYITNKEGQITQTLAYLPYGEDWIDLDNQPPYITPYKFNGKEKDQETGYQYFGARYLNPTLSIWLSVDPMSDKAPSMTPYNYCFNNPIKLFDPDGKWPKGVTFRYFKGGASIGVGYALSANQQSGIASDKYGKTHFVMSRMNHFSNQNLQECSTNPNLYAGAEVGASVGFEYNWNADSFAETLTNTSISYSLGGKAIVGTGVGFSENSASFELSLGLGVGITAGSMSVDYSVSLSKNEAKKVDKMSDVITESWGVDNIEPTYNNGKISGFTGTVFTQDKKGKKINTGIPVQSGYTLTKNGKYAKTDNIWLSKEYKSSIEN